MKTWHARSDGWLSDEPNMSDRKNAASSVVSAIDVARKAALIQTPSKRQLLFFLQAMSMKPGGLKQVAADMLESFPERLGTPTMHSEGIRPGKVYSEKAASCIRGELGSLYENDVEHAIQSLDLRVVLDGSDDPKHRERTEPIDCRTSEYFLDSCRAKFEKEIPHLLVRMCVDPRLEIHSADESANRLDRAKIEEAFPDLGAHQFRCSSVSIFKNFTGALCELQRRYSKLHRQNFVSTGIAKTIFDHLDFSLKTAQIVVIEGKEGVGKSEAVQTWVEMHPDQARMVRLTSITNRSTFFRAIAEALGIGASFARTANEIQNRVEKVLQSSRIMLVIDEAHALISGSKHVTTRPELVDWVYTALQNHGVPCALVATPQFSVLMSHAEKQTGWNSWQFKRRVKRFVQLPERQSVEDLAAVVSKLLPGATKAIINYIVGYAGMRSHQMDGIVDVVREAKLLAEAADRTNVTFDDIERAVTLVVEPTEKARHFVPQTPKRAQRKRPEAVLQDPCNKPVPMRNELQPESDFAGIQPESRLRTSNQPSVLETGLATA